MAQRDDIHELARGRWRGILMAAGFNEKHLNGKHGPCPFCEGTDRWRWTNKDDNGGAICNVCGPKTGVDLVMAMKNVAFLEAKKWIMGEIGKSPVERQQKRGNESSEKRLSKLWSEASRLDGKDPASLYLAHRRIKLVEYPKLLRFHPRVAYDKREDGSWIFHPALLQKFVAADAKRWTMQVSYLDPARARPDRPSDRRLARGVPVPLGGAVRLANSAETMGVAEGVETALSAQLMLGVPVWATLSTGCLVKWEPPETAKNILIFADYDETFGGQAAAFSLAHKLAGKGLHVEVRMPPDLGDWNDALVAEQSEFA